MTGERATAARLFLVAFYRRPLNVALLVAVPPVVVYSYSMALGATGGTAEGQVDGALFATAFLTGVFGLFQVIEAANADRRLVACGFRARDLLATRLVTVAAVGVLVAVVSLGVLSTFLPLAAPLAAFGALALAGVVYGLVGALVGSVLSRRLEGSLLLAFVADLDAFFGGGAGAAGALLPKLLPLYFPRRLLGSAAFDGAVAPTAAGATGLYALVLLPLVLLAYDRTMATTGGGDDD